MINYISGNIFYSKTEAIVNPVNCVGVMGKGLALNFKKEFPDNYKSYYRACKNGYLTVGRVFVFERYDKKIHRYIINFPTKQHWKNKSTIKYIEDGMEDLVNTIINKNIHSISLPKLGCGNGGLLWDDVKPVIEESVKEIYDIDIYIYE